MAGILNEFVQNTKILSSKVNENFSIVQDDIIELGQAINSNFTQQLVSVKNDLLTDIETKLDLSFGNADNIFVENLLKSITPDYSSGVPKSANTEYEAETSGLIYVYGGGYYRDQPKTVAITINGANFTYGYGNLRYGETSGDIYFGGTARVSKGDKYKATGNITTFVFYPIKGVTE